MTWGQWRRTAALVLVLGALFLVPPSVRVDGTNDIAWCRALGIEWREPVRLSTALTPSQTAAVDRYLAEGGLADRSEAEQRIAQGCSEARQDRQTLVVVAAAFVVGVLVVRRNRLESASRPPAAQVSDASSRGQ